MDERVRPCLRCAPCDPPPFALWCNASWFGFPQHMFLETNIKKWLTNANSCPICRAELPSASGGARLDPELEAFRAARQVAAEAESGAAAAATSAAPGGYVGRSGPETAGGMLSGARLARAPAPGSAGYHRGTRAHSGYPMAGGAATGSAGSGAWQRGPRYERSTEGDGCCVA